VHLKIHETPSGICTLEGWTSADPPPDTIAWIRPSGRNLAVKSLESQIRQRHAWLYVVDETKFTMPPEVE